MAGEKVFIDSNILIYTSNQLSPFHEKAKSKLEELEMQQDQVWISRQIIREYFVVVSRIMLLNQRYDPKQLIEMEQMFHQVFRIADEDLIACD